MRKTRLAGLFLCAVLALCNGASAQTLPSVQVFSPGLIQKAEQEADNPTATAEGSVQVRSVAYARDLSVLRAMLDGTTMTYAYDPNGSSLTLTREGEELGTYSLPALSESGQEIGTSLMEFPLLERVALTETAELLENLTQGQSLLLGWTVDTPITLTRTLSDDGLRLTKINVSGALKDAQGEIWTLNGYIRQPGGRAPKDTAELTLTKDEKNTLVLTYSAQYQATVTKKDREGTVTLQSVWRVDGKLAGYGITSKIKVNANNSWKADGENLSEKITVTTDWIHRDRTPSRRMIRLNEADGQVKQTIRLASDSQEITDNLTVTLTMDGNTALDADAQLCLTLGQAQPVPDAPEFDAQAAEDLAKKIYSQLGESVRKRISDGL